MQYVNNLPPSVFQAFYPSKLLLFGEHTVLQGSQALAMPLSKFGGTWAFSNDRALQYNLSEFNAYLKELVKNTDLKLDIAAFGDALNQGLIFQSNIPSGYGVGSSGALVAAIYTAFCSEKTENLLDLKTILGKMEGFFHGASSGLDPLICYMQKAVLINKGGSMEIVDIPKSNISLFLIDTKMTRKAGNLIKIFAEKCEQEYYKNLVINDLVPNINDAIAAFLQNQKTVLFEAIHHISFFQHRFFPEAIPLPFKQIWLEGLASDNYKLKLCGAGGGGFILGFSKNITETQVIFKRFGFDMIAL